MSGAAAESAWKVPGFLAHELVGFGASGEVWRGADSVTGEPVALKRLPAPDDAARVRVRREAALLATLQHPHLVRVHCCVSTDDAEVLVLDYAAGGSLAALLRHRRRLPAAEVVTVIAPITAALAHAHTEGLVHGDVTPSNVLFTADGRPLLADLGVARVAAESGLVATTPDYIDPAVARGGSPGEASDVFAAAAVAFHALTGVPVWNGATAEDVLRVAATGEVPDLRELASDAPVELLEVLARALSPDPAQRGSAAELALDVRHACRPEPVELLTGGRTSVPSAARPSALTHTVAPARRIAAPDASGSGGRHRRRPASIVGIGAAVRNKTVRAAVLGVAALAVAVRIGVAWAGMDAPGIDAAAVNRSGSGAADPHPRESTATGSDSGGAVAGAGAVTGSSAASPHRSPVTPLGSPPQKAATASVPRSGAIRSGSPRTAGARPSVAGGPTGRSVGPGQGPFDPGPVGSAGLDGSGAGASGPAHSGETSVLGDRWWVGRLDQLDRQRGIAFATTDPARLSSVYAVNSAQLPADTSTLRALARQRLRIRGVSHRLRSVDVVTAGASTARLTVRESLSAYDVVRSGVVTQHVPAAPTRTYRVVLTRSSSGWLIQSMVATP